MNNLSQSYTNKLSDDLLRKKIMKRVYARWFFTKKLPFVAGEFIVIAFLFLMAQSRLSLSAIFSNAVAASSGPMSLAKFMTSAFYNTTPGVRLLTAVLITLAAIAIKDIYTAGKYKTLVLEQ